MSRFLTILLVALTFSLVVWSHPVQADQSLVAREAGAADQVVVILTNLKHELSPEIESLRNHQNAHVDTSADVKRMQASVQKARADIAALDKTQFQSLTSAESNRIKDAAKELVEEVVKVGSGSGVALRGIRHEPRQAEPKKELNKNLIPDIIASLDHLEIHLRQPPVPGPLLARLEGGVQGGVGVGGKGSMLGEVIQ